jgi:iron(II)-dependent oxidoreductase
MSVERNDEVSRQLQDARRRTRALTLDLDGAQLLGPRLEIVNPVLWELGHVAWFQERWCLRLRSDESLSESLLEGADALYDSSAVAHDTRWDLPLPSRAATLDYQDQVLGRVLEKLEREADNEWFLYFAQLALFHEDMHAEAFHYTRQTLGYSDPLARGPRGEASAIRGETELPGGKFLLGAFRNTGFHFDNEKWAHPVEVRPFRIARTPVTNAEYLGFVRAGGYRRREWWSDEGWRWRESAGASAPRYWVEKDGAWRERRFGDEVKLEDELPVMHVNWHEANAYCRYAKRRLPSETEWEFAATYSGNGGKRRYPWGDAEDRTRANLDSGGRAPVSAFAGGDSLAGCRQMLGNVWEWTSSAFEPYLGFVCDPYRDYSEPWFGTRKVLRGGSFSTPSRLVHNMWRNFYTPDRSDIFAGFRTCPIE